MAGFLPVQGETTLSNSHRCQTTEYLCFLLLCKSAGFKTFLSQYYSIANSPVHFQVSSLSSYKLFTKKSSGCDLDGCDHTRK